jgi:hypothetical protein
VLASFRSSTHDAIAGALDTVPFGIGKEVVEDSQALVQTLAQGDLGKPGPSASDRPANGAARRRPSLMDSD